MLKTYIYVFGIFAQKALREGGNKRKALSHEPICGWPIMKHPSRPKVH